MAFGVHTSANFCSRDINNMYIREICRAYLAGCKQSEIMSTAFLLISFFFWNHLIALMVSIQMGWGGGGWGVSWPIEMTFQMWVIIHCNYCGENIALLGDMNVSEHSIWKCCTTWVAWKQSSSIKWNYILIRAGVIT